ncbi:hypothetical protein PRIPAC_93638 [Pristionchus pacificus]|uniref:Peptidase n=1 Tax=Pristionchus pacificus TaxID=54126 RepID=A0A2A6CD15_PRIPA|nr:hypothetical protein PRIPAC_93638 [Pristionchus pacificus]|eukprot:PDM76092.1 Peptidase [Pristionchus pacificus]
MLPVTDESIANSEALGTDWFTQTFDHFNPEEERTFEQQRFYNYKYGSSDGPNFLMFGGAYPENMGWVVRENVTWMIYAEATGANVFCLAHRYYGQSKLGTKTAAFFALPEREKSALAIEARLAKMKSCISRNSK